MKLSAMFTVLSVLALSAFPSVNCAPLPTGKFTGVFTCKDGISNQISITTDEDGIQHQNLDMGCGNNDPISPSSFEDGKLEYTTNSDYGSWFNRKNKGECMSGASVILQHESENEWTFEYTVSSETSTGTLTFQCTKECENRSKCNGVYSSDDNGDSFGVCEALEPLDAWNDELNDSAICPLPNLPNAVDTDTRITVVEITRTLNSTTCNNDAVDDCSSEILIDLLPSLMLLGHEVLVAVPSTSESDTTEIVLQRQDDDVVISYTVSFEACSVEFFAYLCYWFNMQFCVELAFSTNILTFFHFPMYEYVVQRRQLPSVRDNQSHYWNSCRNNSGNRIVSFHSIRCHVC